MTGLRVPRAGVVVPPVLLVLLLLAVWEVYAATAGPGPDVLPTPSRVVEQGWADRENLLANTWPTLRATVIGLLLSILVGFAFAVLVDLSSLARRAVLPVLVVSQTLPLVALAPLVIVWFGFGQFPKILLIVFVNFFATTLSFVEGFRSADPDSVALLRSMGAGRWRVFRTVRLPSALPYFMAGLRIAITYSVVSAIFAEYAGAEAGLGVYMQFAKNTFRTDLVLAAVGVTAAVTLLLFGLSYLIERLALPWAHLVRAGEAQS
ncbi:ABC transporter permease [Kineosporia sp. NBRC 101677]|uniref:ABC transporter permease n=1 Tax=Kineosporia sp. NBRC 101677 TaxID=3032197 RepID=UPI0024A05A96|nr:ABC transporter permease [Kineosporia sp. NBRC 101677]GLY16963.1 ABC transporter permease [Kineosporia sp. NBRC 101677]